MSSNFFSWFNWSLFSLTFPFYFTICQSTWVKGWSGPWVILLLSTCHPSTFPFLVLQLVQPQSECHCIDLKQASVVSEHNCRLPSLVSGPHNWLTRCIGRRHVGTRLPACLPFFSCLCASLSDSVDWRFLLFSVLSGFNRLATWPPRLWQITEPPSSPWGYFSVTNMHHHPCTSGKCQITVLGDM